MTPDFIAQHCLLFAIIVDATLGVFVLLRNPRHATHNTYFILVCAILFWQVSTYIALFTSFDESVRLIAVRCIYAAILIALCFVLYFVSMFGSERHRKIWLGCIVVGAALMSIGIIGTSGVFSAVSYRTLHTQEWYQVAVLGIVFLSACIFASIIQRLVTVVDQRERNQLEYMILGLFVPIFFGVFSTVILSFLEREGDSITISHVGVFGAATTCFFSFVMAYAMARHRFMDIHLMVKRKTLALIMTILVILSLAVVLVLVFPGTIQLGSRGIVLILALFAVITVVFYEVFLISVSTFVKRGVLDFAARTYDEQAFLRFIDSPQKWARKWAGMLQRRFGVESIECVTYDHRAQCWKQVFPMSRMKYALDEEWITVLQNREIKVYSLEQDNAMLLPVVRQLEALDRLVCAALHDQFRCMGVWLLGKKLDGSEWSKEDKKALKEMALEAEKELWMIMQTEHVMITAMEEGAPLPMDLIKKEEWYDE